MGLDNLLYWEEADAWYAAHTDTSANTVTLTGGERTDDGLLKLSYSGGCITLRPRRTDRARSPTSSFPTSRRVDADRRGESEYALPFIVLVHKVSAKRKDSEHFCSESLHLVRPTGFEPAAFRVGVIRPSSRKALQGKGFWLVLHKFPPF